MAKANGWWESRLGLKSALRESLDEEIPGGAKFTYALGSATILTFFTLAVTGIWELFYYVPSVSGAYDSVNYIRYTVPYGWLIHGLHFWAASAMVVLVLLHLVQAFIWGAFKKPRELTWVLGALLLIFTLGSVFSGGPLGWDEKGFWAANVGAGLAGSIPGIGTFLQGLIFGGQPIGQSTLSRLFTFHIALFPILILGLFALHMIAFRKGGAAGSIKESTKVGKFWPEQVLMDLLVFSGILAVLVWLSATAMPLVSGPGDPVDPTYVARPDWPFLWLFQMLKYLSGSLEWLGFVLVPLVGILLLFAVPWLDRKEARSPAKRPISMVVFAIIVVGISAMTYLGATAQPPAVTAPTGAPPATPASALETTPNTGLSVASHTIGSAEHGQVIFVAYCQQCHGVDGKKGITNPNSVDGEIPAINPIDSEISGADKQGKITDVQKFVDGLDNYLQNGSSPDATPDGADPKYKMPSFGNTFALSQPQIADVEAYVLQLHGVDRVALAKPDAPKTYALWTLGGFFVVAVVGGVALVGGRKKKR